MTLTTTIANTTKDTTMTTHFHGVIPPVVTPLTTDGDLDVVSYEKLINRLIEQGVDGLFILGSTSEVAFFDDEMRGRVLGEAKRIIDGRVPLLAGVIDTETLRVIRHIRQAEEIGVDAVVATAPFYAITGPTEIENHFRPARGHRTAALRLRHPGVRARQGARRSHDQTGS